MMICNILPFCSVLEIKKRAFSLPKHVVQNKNNTNRYKICNFTLISVNKNFKTLQKNFLNSKSKYTINIKLTKNK